MQVQAKAMAAADLSSVGAKVVARAVCVERCVLSGERVCVVSSGACVVRTTPLLGRKRIGEECLCTRAARGVSVRGMAAGWAQGLCRSCRVEDETWVHLELRR